LLHKNKPAPFTGTKDDMKIFILDIYSAHMKA